MWTNFEKELLINEYREKGTKIPQLLLTHSKKTIRNKAGCLGLCYKPCNYWNDEKLNILKKNFSSKGTNISQLLATHTKKAIQHKASRLGLQYCGIYKSLKEIKISKELQSIIDGLLLGDGGFEYTKYTSHSPKTANISITQTEKTKEWLYDIKKRLENEEVFVSDIRRHGKERDSIINGNIIHIKKSFRINTSRYVDFKDEMAKWGCVNTKKTKIPDDCSIDPLVLAYWYMGDGTLVYKEGYRYNLSFATCCFTKESQELFRNRLEEKYGWKFKIAYKKGYKHPFLHMYGQDDILSFLETTKPFMVNCFSYKWRALWDERWLTRKRPNYFTDDEKLIIKKRFSVDGTNIPCLLKRHSHCSIQSQANKLGVYHKNFWTDEEINILKKKYPGHGRNISELLKTRSMGAIINMALRLKIKHNKHWTDEEINILKSDYPIKGRNIPELLKTRTKYAIALKAKKLKIKRNF